GWGVIPELADLRVVVDAEYIQQPLPGGGLVPAQLVEEPRQVLLAAVLLPVGEVAPAVLAAVLLVAAAVEIAAPAPLLGADHHGRGIDRLDLARVVEDPVADLLHRCA